MQQQIVEEQSDEEVITIDVIIVGAGPAGLTAGIYASRSGLKVVVVEKGVVGGQILLTPTVENWPGFKIIPGQQLMEMIGLQAREYVTIFENEAVQEIKIGKNIEAVSSRHRFLGRALIIATGASHRRLGVEGEERFSGRGVSYCATCDGNLFKGKDVVVIGGGNTALTDALYLHTIGARVTIIHRGGHLQAEQILQDSVKRERIKIIFNTTIKKISGTNSVQSITIHYTATKKEKKLPVAGVFVAIGEIPANQLAIDIDLPLDEAGFIKIDRFGRTIIPRIYAAGDITRGIRQIVTTVGEGAAAAISVFDDMTKQSMQKKE